MKNATQTTRGKFSREALPTAISYYTSQGIELKGNGVWRDAICQFHADTTPSLRVNVETGGYKCMSCGARGGDVLDFEQQKHGLNFIEACKKLGAWLEVNNGY